MKNSGVGTRLEGGRRRPWTPRGPGPCPGSRGVRGARGGRGRAARSLSRTEMTTLPSPCRTPTPTIAVRTIVSMAVGTTTQLGWSPSAPTRHQGTAMPIQAPIGRAPTTVAATPTPCRCLRPAGPRSVQAATRTRAAAAPMIVSPAGSVVICEALARRASSVSWLTVCGTSVPSERVSAPRSVAPAGRLSAWPLMEVGTATPRADRNVGARSVSWTSPAWWVEGLVRTPSSRSRPVEPEGSTSA